MDAWSSNIVRFVQLFRVGNGGYDEVDISHVLRTWTLQSLRTSTVAHGTQNYSSEEKDVSFTFSTISMATNGIFHVDTCPLAGQSKAVTINAEPQGEPSV